MKKIIKYIFLLLIIWFTAHTIFIIYDGTRKPKQRAHAIVILGNKVNEDGSLSQRLKKRLDTGIELYKDGMSDIIIVSGGLGNEGYYEGDKMAEYLISQGIPESTIIIDNKGDNTELTAQNADKICESKYLYSVIVVSQYFHITRTKYHFSQYFTKVEGASPAYFEWRDLYAIPREFAAYYAAILK
jgi:vancomycin permeability regulator SanA